MTVSDSIGIGTTSPAVKLHVSAPTGSQSIYLTPENNDGTSGLALWFANNYADPFFTNKNWVGLGQDNIDNSLRFSTTGSGSFSDATMTITTNGNVGIGTTEPQAKLDIGGTPGVDGIRFPDGTVQTSAEVTPCYWSGVAYTAGTTCLRNRGGGTYWQEDCHPNGSWQPGSPDWCGDYPNGLCGAWPQCGEGIGCYWNNMKYTAGATCLVGDPYNVNSSVEQCAASGQWMFLGNSPPCGNTNSCPPPCP